MKRLLFLLATALNLFAQGQAVNLTLGPAPSAWVSLYWCGTSGTACATGNTNVSYICYSPALSGTTVYSIGATPALTNIVVASNVGTITFGATAQVWVGQIVTVAGSTTSALNASYRINTVSGSTATITKGARMGV